MIHFRARWERLESLFGNITVFEKARWCVPFFYFLVEFMALNQIMRYDQLAHVRVEPFWPIIWTTLIGQLEFLPELFLAILCIAASIGAIWYRFRAARAIAFVGIMQYQAFIIAAFGSEHDFYIPLFISALFIFLPDAWRGNVSLDARKRFTVIFWGAQAYLLLTYTMSGFYKLVSVYPQYMHEEAHYFSLDAGGLYVAYWLEQFGRTSMLGNFIVEHQYASWLALAGIMYVLVFAIWAAFAPSLQRLWGFGIIAFHFSTALSMSILFLYNPLFAGMFLLASPFTPENNDWRQVLRDLPLIGFLARAIL
jgi:hypothetical protein